MNGLSTVSFQLGAGLFNFRVAGVAVQNGKLLLHKMPSDHFWSLPGGRVDIFEVTKETLLREMIEETSFSVIVGDLLWVVENFFEYNQVRHHEIGFYYKMEIEQTGDQEDFLTTEPGSELRFHWHELDDLYNIKIYPDFVSKELIENTTFTRHIVEGLRNLNAG